MNPGDKKQNPSGQDVNHPGSDGLGNDRIPKKKGNDSFNNISVSSISRGYQNVDRAGGLHDNHLVFGSSFPNPNGNALNRNQQNIPFSKPFQSSLGPARPLLDKRLGRNWIQKSHSKNRPKHVSNLSSKHVKKGFNKKRRTDGVSGFIHQYAQFKEENPFSNVTPDEFSELIKRQQELKALEAAKASNKKAKKDPWLKKHVWSSKIFPEQEPRIYFCKSLRLLFMRRLIIDVHSSVMIPDDMRNTWKTHAIELHESLDENLKSFSNPNEFEHRYEEDFELTAMGKFNFPMSKYFEHIDPDKDMLLASLRDYIRCRREGIPVVKLEKPLYMKYTKYLWCTDVLRDTAQKVDFDDNLLKQRMQYILCDSIVYQELSVDYRISWLNHVEWLVSWVKSYHSSNDFWPREVRKKDEENRPTYASIKKHLIKQGFPFIQFVECHEEGFDIILHLVDSVYCCEHGIEVEKLWKFEFPNGFDYLLAKSNDRKRMSMDVNHPLDNVSNENRMSMDVNHPLDDVSNEKVETDISTEEQKELGFLAKFPKPKSVQTIVCDRLNTMKSLYHEIVGEEFCNRYAKVSKHHYLYEDHFHKDVLKDLITRFEYAMQTEYKVIYKKVKKSEIENDSLIKDTREGTQIISNLHKNIGFNLGFLEILVHNEKDSSNLLLGDNDDHCCFCPLNSSVASKNDTLEDKDKFYCPSPCQNTEIYSRSGLIDHLHEHAYQHADVNHYAAYYYLKHVCRVMEYKDGKKNP
jgi:hypothetical protein